MMYLESQVTQNNRPLYLNVAHNPWKVTHNYGPPAFQVGLWLEMGCNCRELLRSEVVPLFGS